MNTRRFASVSTSWRYVVLTGCTFALLAAIGPAGIKTTTASIADTGGSSLADAKPAQAPQATKVAPAVDAPQVADTAPRTNEATQGANAPQLAQSPDITDSPRATESNQAAISNDATTPAVEPVTPATTGTVTASDTSQASDKPQPTFDMASADPTELLPDIKPTPRTPEQLPPSNPLAPVNSVEVFDECFSADICVDRYLWALYQRTPKEDKMKVSEQRAVTIKKKRKMVTVMKTFTKLVDEDFAWKDEAASNKFGMPMQDYVIGGMDHDFKLKLFHVLYAAEAAGLSPGITSAFRDDYRQTIASGLKAASNRSYHGGSLRGGYGHGLAADIVSVKGATRAERWAATEVLWKWVDEHGKEFGIGRPYLSYDPPHVGPIDGPEYVSRRGGDKVQQAFAEMKKPKPVAARHAHESAKRAKSVVSSKPGKIRSARNKPARTA